MGFKFNPLYGTLDIAGSAGAGTGDVVGPASATDNAIARFDGTTGKLIQNSAVTIADSSGNMAGVGTINTLVLPSSDFVGRTDTQTLTNKTLTSPIISTISNTGTLTLPTSTDTLVGKATTDTFTNKTITATSNTLGGVTMTLGSDATGDMYYRNSSGYLTRLGIGSSDDVLKVSGGLPSWGAASSGGTYMTLELYAGFPDNTATPGSMQVVVGNNGTGSGNTFNNPKGLSFATGSTATGVSYAYYHMGTTAATSQNIFDYSPRAFFHSSFLTDNTAANLTFLGIGGNYANTPSADGTARKIVGFRISRSSSVSTVYAVVGSGSAETATDVTSSITDFSASDFNKPLFLWFDMTSGTNVKFYWNNTLLTTTTTNLPSGSPTTINMGLGAFIYNNNTGAPASNALYLKQAYMQLKLA